MTKSAILPALAVVALLPASCTVQEDPRTAAARSYVREVTGDDLKGAGRLQISTNDVTTDGRFAKIRGTVENKFSEPVDGVRYVVTIYAAGTPPKVLARWKREVDTVIEPGERAAMRLDVESMYFGGAGRSFNIEAQPVKVGTKSMPLPEGWSN